MSNRKYTVVCFKNNQDRAVVVRAGALKLGDAPAGHEIEVIAHDVEASSVVEALRTFASTAPALVRWVREAVQALIAAPHSPTTSAVRVTRRWIAGRGLASPSSRGACRLGAVDMEIEGIDFAGRWQLTRVLRSFCVAAVPGRMDIKLSDTVAGEPDAKAIWTTSAEVLLRAPGMPELNVAGITSAQGVELENRIASQRTHSQDFVRKISIIVNRAGDRVVNALIGDTHMNLYIDAPEAKAPEPKQTEPKQTARCERVPVEVQAKPTSNFYVSVRPGLVQAIAMTTGPSATLKRGGFRRVEATDVADALERGAAHEPEWLRGCVESIVKSVRGVAKCELKGAYRICAFTPSDATSRENDFSRWCVHVGWPLGSGDRDYELKVGRKFLVSVTDNRVSVRLHSKGDVGRLVRAKDATEALTKATMDPDMPASRRALALKVLASTSAHKGALLSILADRLHDRPWYLWTLPFVGDPTFGPLDVVAPDPVAAAAPAPAPKPQAPICHYDLRCFCMSLVPPAPSPITAPALYNWYMTQRFSKAPPLAVAQAPAPAPASAPEAAPAPAPVQVVAPASAPEAAPAPAPAPAPATSKPERKVYLRVAGDDKLVCEDEHGDGSRSSVGPESVADTFARLRSMAPLELDMAFTIDSDHGWLIRRWLLPLLYRGARIRARFAGVRFAPEIPKELPWRRYLAVPARMMAGKRARVFRRSEALDYALALCLGLEPSADDSAIDLMKTTEGYIVIDTGEERPSTLWAVDRDGSCGGAITISLAELDPVDGVDGIASSSVIASSIALAAATYLQHDPSERVERLFAWALANPKATRVDEIAIRRAELAAQAPAPVAPTPAPEPPGGLIGRVLSTWVDGGRAVIVTVARHHPGVELPAAITEPLVNLRIGRNLTPAIPDLEITDAGVSGTLAFGLIAYKVTLPWDSILAVGDARAMGELRAVRAPS